MKPSLRLISLLALCLVIQARTAWAVTEKKSIVKEFQSIELLRDNLFKGRRSAKVHLIKKALAALQDGKYALARKHAIALQSDELFSDYGIALTASSYQNEAAAMNRARRFKDSIEAARKAAVLYLKIEAEHPYSPMLKRIPEELGQTEIILGDAYRGLGGKNAKENELEQIQANYERAFQRLLSQQQLGMIRPPTLENYAEACSKQPSFLCPSWIQKLASVYPKQSEELRALVKYFPEAADRDRPSGNGGKLTQTYRANDLDLTAFDAAMATYLDGKYSQANEAFHRFLDEFPKSSHRFRARYWLGQALTQDQQHEKAQRVYEDLLRESPTSYYGLLASFACGKSVDSYIDGALPMAAPNDPSLQPVEMIRLRRAERFVAEGIKDLAAQDLRELRARDALSSPFLMYLATLNFEAGNFTTSFSILSDLIQRGYDGVFSSFGLRLIFPLYRMDLIQRYSSQLKLDPILVLSLIKQESAFDFRAVSVAGASGLMQLMPATAVDTEPEVKRADLVDPETNIRVGTKYFRKLMTRFNGNIVLSLAGYNAGPNAVDRWVRENKAKRGMLEFIEAIPYRETREYVSSIVRNYFWYSRKLNGETPKTLGYFWNIYGPPELPS